MEKPNHLLDSTSPYLLQHAFNPVDWYPWGAEALDRARRENKPIFLSIGYSACHWCHVMAHESFENAETAAIMNAHFINIKVDREERPDLDDLYMLATQIMSGSGGWPMSVWLTPDLEPFYAGTYFPPADGFGRPRFARLELAIADAWQNKREELAAQAKRVVEAIRVHADESAVESAGGEMSAADVDRWLAGALQQAADRFDKVHGGLGSAPKFPPHQALHLWLAMLGNVTGKFPPAALDAARNMVTQTLDGMMRGGIYDHVGGGFARYSTDERWLVPHFEKMLYDNAQLASAYAIASDLLARPDYARVARQTLDFWLREMTLEGEGGGTGGGGFYSALDADSQGAEGKFYVWTLADLRAALPDDDDAALMIEHLGISETGNWHEAPVPGASVLAIAQSVEALAKRRKVSPAALQSRIDELFVAMRAYRAQRVPPGLDDKILTAWNGLMISALAICGRVLAEPRYLRAGDRAAEYLMATHLKENRLLRVSRRSGSFTAAHTPGFLDDHAFLLNGVVDLMESAAAGGSEDTHAALLRRRAAELADTLTRDFADPRRGGFFFAAPGHDALFARMKNAADNATPSANGMAIRALLRLARISSEPRYREAAMRGLRAFASNIDRHPDFFPTLLQSLLEDTAGLHIDPAAAILPPIGRPLPPGANPLLDLTADPLPSLSDDTFQLRLHLRIAEGFHIQGRHPAEKESFATVARLQSGISLEKEEWSYPPPNPGGVYTGTVTFTATCTLAPDVPSGHYSVRATVLAQPCSQTSCLEVQKVSVESPITVEGH